MVKRTIVLVLGLCGTLSAHAERKTDSPASFVALTKIAPDLHVAAEVSLRTPYLGEQLSIVYSLRALDPPVAIDIEPQQYIGLWTEVVPLGESSGVSRSRLVQGKASYEFLLRQVIAYPLQEGELHLPPLALKIKMTRTAVSSPGEWDLVASSEPIAIRVRPPPSFERAKHPPALVGRISGRLSEIKRSTGSEMLLELRGTANLAFFDVDEWLKGFGLAALPPRLIHSENQVQTEDLGGKRQLRLTQFRQWAIRILPQNSSAIRIENPQIALFDPGSATWSSHSVEGTYVASAIAGEQSLNLTPAKRDTSRVGSKNIFISRILPIALVAGLVVGLGWFWWRWRMKSSPRSWHSELRVLEKQSRVAPRSFLETAHRILDRYARENHLTHSHVTRDDPFTRCWLEIERGRFMAADPPIEVRTLILNSIHVLVSGKHEEEAR